MTWPLPSEAGRHDCRSESARGGRRIRLVTIARGVALPCPTGALRYNTHGGVSERLMVPLSKSGVRASVPWVRIPPPPPPVETSTPKARLRQRARGEVLEWTIRRAWRARDRASGPWVRIPPSPPPQALVWGARKGRPSGFRRLIRPCPHALVSPYSREACCSFSTRISVATGSSRQSSSSSRGSATLTDTSCPTRRPAGPPSSAGRTRVPSVRR